MESTDGSSGDDSEAKKPFHGFDLQSNGAFCWAACFGNKTRGRTGSIFVNSPGKTLDGACLYAILRRDPLGPRGKGQGGDKN